MQFGGRNYVRVILNIGISAGETRFYEFNALGFAQRVFNACLTVCTGHARYINSVGHDKSLICNSYIRLYSPSFSISS